MGNENAIRRIQYDYKDHQLLIQFRDPDDAKVLADIPESSWTSDDQQPEARCNLPKSALYHYVTDRFFVLVFKDLDSAEAWSKPHAKLWRHHPIQKHGAAPVSKERRIELYYSSSDLESAFGEDASTKKKDKKKKEKTDNNEPAKKEASESTGFIKSMKRIGKSVAKGKLKEENEP